MFNYSFYHKFGGVEEFPASWVKMNADEELKLITVSPGQQEYQDVLNSFQLTANVNTVVKVCSNMVKFIEISFLKELM